MINGLTLNTNLVKLRSDVYSAIEAIVTDGCSAGDLVYPNTDANCVGVAVEAVPAGASGVLVYKADRIVVPCDFDASQKTGATIGFSISSGKIVAAADGDFAVGILKEAATSASTEAEIELWGFLLTTEGT